MTALLRLVDKAIAEDACREVPPDEFFIEGKSKRARAEREAIRQTFCNPCPVRATCLADAIERDEQFGMWGGVDFGTERYLLPDTSPPVERPA